MTTIPDFFEADDTLAAYLLSLGYTDVTSAVNKQKGKRQFRHPQRRTKQVYFDYINLHLQHGRGYNWSGLKLSRAGLQFWHENDVSQKMEPELKRLAESAPAPSAKSSGVLTADDELTALFYEYLMLERNTASDKREGLRRFTGGYNTPRTVIFWLGKVQMKRGGSLDFMGKALPLTAFRYWAKADMSQPYQQKRFKELLTLDPDAAQ